MRRGRHGLASGGPDVAALVAILTVTWAWVSSAVVLPYVAGSLALEVDDIAAANRLFLAAAAASLFAAGVIADRLGWIVTLRVGTAAVVLGMLANASAQGLAGLLAAQATAGVGAALIVAATLPRLLAGPRRLLAASGVALLAVLTAPFAAWLTDGTGWRSVHLAAAAGGSIALLSSIKAQPAPPDDADGRIARISTVFGRDTDDAEPMPGTPRSRPLADVAVAVAMVAALLATAHAAGSRDAAGNAWTITSAIAGAAVSLAGAAFIAAIATDPGHRWLPSTVAPLAAACLGLAGLLSPLGQWPIAGLGAALGLKLDEVAARRPSLLIGAGIAGVGLFALAPLAWQGRPAEAIADLIARTGLGATPALRFAVPLAILIRSLVSLGLGAASAGTLQGVGEHLPGDRAGRISMAVVAAACACTYVGEALLRAG